MSNMTEIQPHVNEKSSSSSSDASIWDRLKHWIEEKDNGGHVHSALHLETIDTDNRGVIAGKKIDQGELLIRLPIECALSGRTVLGIPNFEKSLRQKSSWMQCVAAYYHALLHDPRWKPYLDSLPTSFETLFQWSDEEIKTYLRGTTLGTMVLADRIDGSINTRYQTAVRPVLQELALLEGIQKADERKRFLDACMCISTRGFHYSSDSSLAKEDESYQGPFLLPIIDLLNHNPSKSCTTLQYSEGCFRMVAERLIAQGEEIFHSYGDALTSSQLLQTFGFVMVPSAEIKTNKVVRRCLTPASLSMSKHLIPACQEIKQSEIPKRLQSKLALKARQGEEDEEETWEVSVLPIRKDDGILSEDILIDCNQDNDNDDDDDNDKNHLHKGLTDELITFMCLQFLPTDAYDEMCDHDGKVSALLDASILQDLYLGIMVCRSLLLALHKKLDDYDEANEAPAMCLCETTNGVVDRLEALLLAEQPMPSTFPHRAQYGWTIRKEELSNLKMWAIQVSCIMKSLYEELKGAESSADGVEEPKAKRTKVETE